MGFVTIYVAFVPHILLHRLCHTYDRMHLEKKKHFLLILARDLHIDTEVVSSENVNGVSSDLSLIKYTMLTLYWLKQALQSAAQFEQNLIHVRNQESKSVDWDHENIERYLRTFRNLCKALSPLYEVWTLKMRSWLELFSRKANGGGSNDHDDAL